MADQDIVDLRIEAENLASEKLVAVAEDVEGLGRKTESAQKDLERLQISNQTLQSFDRATSRIEELQNEVAEAAAEYQKLQSVLKSTENVTDKQTAAVNKQKNAVKLLEGDLRAAEREYRKIDASLRNAGVNTKDFTKEQARLNSELVQARKEADKLNSKYDEQVASLRERVNQQKKVVTATKEEAAAQTSLTQKIDQQNAARRASVNAAVAEAKADRELAAVLSRYEAELSRLNDEKREGNITTGNYIRAEAALRKQLQLTSAQASVSRRAIEADIEGKTKASKSADLLTTSTRRLAQAYTVIIAAQQAAQAAIGNVQAYGKLESSIVAIERTTGLAADQVTQLADQITTLSKDVTPTASEELLKFAETAGTLGVKSTADILNIVDAADQLGVATNIAGGEAATLLTRILETTGEGVPQIQNLASSVVQLGNNFAASESEIVKFTKEIVTSTRDIGLSSAASAALGTTLAVTGQQAEASRTAIGRLSQAIKRAAVEGGDSLEALSKFTKLSGEEIQDSLGKNAEKVILAFVDSLQKVEGVKLDSLKRFGIDGQEAAKVFGTLAERSDTLRDALGQSSQAFIDGNVHTLEAAKAYATQDAAIGKLNNAYIALRQQIGESFSDETDALVRSFTDEINGSEQAVIDLFEILPDLVAGIGEVVDVVDNLSAAVGGVGGVFTGVVEGFTIFLNGLTAGLNLVIGAVQQLVLGIGQVLDTLQSLAGFDLDIGFLDGLREAISNTKDDIIRDGEDIERSFDRLSGTSSRRYQDLIDVTGKYGDSISRLTDKQQAQLDEIIKSNRYVKENEDVYQELTAALVKVNREREGEETRLKRSKELREAAIKAAEEEAAAKKKIADATAEQNALLSEEDQLVNNLNNNLAGLNAEYRGGTIDIDQLVQRTQSLNSEYEIQSTAAAKVRGNREAEVRSTQAVISEISSLVTQYQKGSITIDEYNQGQQQLEQSLNRSNGALLKAGQTAGSATKEQLKLSSQISNTVLSIKELQKSLDANVLVGDDLIDTTAKLRVEQEKLNALRDEEARVNQIANASYFELQTQRTQAISQLQQLQVQFESGSIGAGEYQEKQAALSKTISELNGLLGTNSEAIDKVTESQKRSVQATNEQGQAVQKAAQYTNLYGQAFNYLNEQFDFANHSASDLGERLEELQGKINTNNRVTSSWWRELAEVNNEGFKREQAMIRETLLLRKWTKQVDSGNTSLAQLENLSKHAAHNINNLSEQQLEPLLDAIAEAKREFQDLNSNIDDALNDTLDRLDEISGNQADIVKRRYEEERKQYEELLVLANQSGDSATINRAQQALRNLEKAQKLEFNNEFNNGNNGLNNGSNLAKNNNQSGDNNNTSTQKYAVDLRLPDGGSTTVNVASQSDVSALLETFESFGSVSSEGGN